jgi:hypothetical protein
MIYCFKSLTCSTLHHFLLVTFWSSIRPSLSRFNSRNFETYEESVYQFRTLNCALVKDSGLFVVYSKCTLMQMFCLAG